ncbi:hypothetical protein EXIGLDRAFT_720596, partial [Exidia glandulosa HHB12029]
MKKLFQRQKTPKAGVPTLSGANSDSPQPSPAPTSDEHWVVLQPTQPPSQQHPHDYNTLPQGAAPLNLNPVFAQDGSQPANHSPRANGHPSPANVQLHPHHAHHPSHTTNESHAHSHGPHGGGYELAGSVSAHSDGLPTPAPKDQQQPAKLQKKGFFGRNSDKDKDKDRERDRDRDRHREREHRDHGGERGDHQEPQHRGPTGQPGELTRMIGYLTGFASDDWTIVLEVCERAAANDANAKEAAKALRREFKYAEPGAQMAAARLWAIMLRYSSDIFIAQTTTKKFLDVVEDVCTSSKTTPVVRERLLEVLAGAAYAHPSSGREGFAGAWRRVKAHGQPDEGIPFDDLDPMFTPPAPKRTHAPRLQYGAGEHGAVPVPYGNERERNPFDTQQRPRGDRRRERTQQSQVVPSVEEDMRRLFEECEVARGNAQLLSQAMTFAKPSELLGNQVIKEFHTKCMASQDFIVAQIPWATANAERSRERLAEQQALAAVAAANVNGPTAAQQQLSHAETAEEQLLATLLFANQDLVEAFRQYDELERIGMQEAEEKEVEARSRVETKLDRTQIQYWTADGSFQLEAPGQSGGPSRSPSPSSFHHSASGAAGAGSTRPSLPHQHSFGSSQGGAGGVGPQIHALPPTPTAHHGSQMPPPPPAPLGPRKPPSRSSSPTRLDRRVSHSQHTGSEPELERPEPRELDMPLAPSAKALGKRRAVE